MYKNEYKWKKRTLFNLYIKDKINALGYLLTLKYDDYEKIKTSIKNLLDMLFPCFLEFRFPLKTNYDLKKELKRNDFLINFGLTEFEKNNIENLINILLNKKINLTEDISDTRYDVNYVCESILFLEQISSAFSLELENSVKSHHFYIEDEKKPLDFCGEFFRVNGENYYHVIDSKNSKTFIAINHEIMHGIIADLTREKYNEIDEEFLFREMINLLIEIYSNEYLFENKLIGYNEYVSNYNDMILTNLYNDIEIIDILYKLAKTPEKNTIKQTKKFIKNMALENPNYNIPLSEITQRPLYHYLMYLYSAAIAMAIYENNKQDMKKGVQEAIEIMTNIKQENEEELFKKYNIRLLEAVDSYCDKNNRLIKRRG